MKATTDLGFGLGLRSPHYRHIIEKKPTSVEWFEIITENLISRSGPVGGRFRYNLEKIRRNYPLVLHGVSLSLGSADPVNIPFLNQLQELIQIFQPAWISDHLCFTGVSGFNTHDLLPLPYTEEAIKNIAQKILKIQEKLKRQIAVENVSSYLEYKHSEMTEWEFLSEVSTKADCLILLDINNIYVSSQNHHFDPELYLKAMPKQRVLQYHLAGHTYDDGIIIDTHAEPIPNGVLELYKKTLQIIGHRSTMIERDANIPEFKVLEQELSSLKKIKEKILGTHSTQNLTKEVSERYSPAMFH